MTVFTARLFLSFGGFFFCFMIEELCLSPSCLYQVQATEQEAPTRGKLHYLGNQSLKPRVKQALYLISIYTLSSLPTPPHILNKISSVNNTINNSNLVE